MKSLKTMLVMILASITVVIFVGQSFFSFFQFKKEVLARVEEKLTLEADNKADQLYGMLQKPAKLSEGLTFTIGTSTIKEINKIEEATKQFVAADPLIVGGGFWMQPNAFDPKAKLFARYAYKDKQDIVFDNQYSVGTFDYFKEDWYKNGFLGRQNVWSAPYKDSVTGVPMITVTSAIKQKNEVIGVATIDIGMMELQKQVTSMKVGMEGHAFIIASDGAYISHRDKDKTMDTKMTEEQNDEIRALGSQIIKSTSHALTLTQYDGKKAYVTYAPIGDTGMKIVTIMYYAEILQPINQYLKTTIIIFTIAMLIFIALLYWFIHRQVSTPLLKLRKEIHTLVEKGGDLTQSIGVSGKNEIGQLATSLNEFIANLRGIVANVVGYANQVEEFSSSSSLSAAEVGNASNQVAVIIQDVANGSSKQTSSVMEIAENMANTQQLVSTTKNEIEQATDNALRATVFAEQGGEAILDAVQEVEKIVEITSETRTLIRKLEESSNQIGEIITTITAIASSTHLLALNASIEAARAGEHGKGFGVVASEIRKLAEQSEVATEKISTLVLMIQQETLSSVTIIEQNSEIVTSLTAKTQLGSHAFSEIKGKVSETEQSILHLHHVIEKVMENSEQVMTDIQEASAISEEMTASTEEVAANIEEQNASINLMSSNLKEMNLIAEQLRNEVSKFIV
ncbi:methyl-accepting chemotaxis protein [Paenibacillus sp. SYP-B3998]|uniref:Methyl-accepting chemotaxis protein n=1 Tax=Paenibacillus sp. SYP-B3998 TaxID=2678564 RepID=A0A6G4A0K7_9BACL|nr:methyl-accepting chemotaxis protein [Paenibacillus sp. SYP-B3998]NEW07905.1 methyl-accepting chemotaxis protein [Paenibacillus sp. SYP-B3998]